MALGSFAKRDLTGSIPVLACLIPRCVVYACKVVSVAQQQCSGLLSQWSRVQFPAGIF